jgi:hypothetical protein
MREVVVSRTSPMLISYLTEALTGRRGQAGSQTDELCLEFLKIPNEPPILARPPQ